MTTMNRFGLVLVSATTLLLGACATTGDPANAPGTGNVYSSNAYSGYGVVQSVEPVHQGNNGIGGTGIGLGTVAGAVIGGVAGHQVGAGSGKTVATAVGAAGGAYIGHELEKRQQQPDAYSFNIRMDNGSYQTLTQASNGGLVAGDRVRINNGVVQRY